MATKNPMPKKPMPKYPAKQSMKTGGKVNVLTASSEYKGPCAVRGKGTANKY